MKFLLLLLALVVSLQAPPKRGHPTSWTFYAVDRPQSAYTVLTGINNLKKITGYGSKGAFTSEAPYSYFASIDYEHEVSVATGLSNVFIQVGYYFTSKGTIGYVRERGRYKSFGMLNSEFLGENNILCPDAKTHCHGEDKNSDPLVVGYAGTKSAPDGFAEPFVFDTVTGTVTTLAPPGAVASVASGINGRGEIVGFMRTAGGQTESWVYRDSTYYVFAYPGAEYTMALAVNWQDNVVGKYADAHGRVHGFVYYFLAPAGSCRVGATCYSVDYPNAVTTAIHSYNDHDEMVGSFVSHAGVTHGFEAEPNNL